MSTVRRNDFPVYLSEVFLCCLLLQLVSALDEIIISDGDDKDNATLSAWSEDMATASERQGELLLC